ncbi:MAG: tRNA epoxyqueuosine(34) reductase QueG [Ignavibacteria bacterium]|nr:tRNA epoxyqueuosine(34) reductase QueG [Ignavibacteria bacterium]
MDRSELTKRVKAIAIELGFDAVGIAIAEPLSIEYQKYEEWIGRGYHGTMSYMERNMDARRDVSAIVPGARSVIVVAKNYYTPRKHDVTGKIARYAWGDDYHVVLPPMLDALIGSLAELSPGSVSHRYTDTGPVLEKAWAVRSGIGWQGKNGNIIRRDIGSWFFLGVVITTADLEPDAPMDDYCGSCTACLELCPTSAIIEPKVVDATKCISYWTIETKSETDFPLPIVEQLDGWFFGCDVCQDVCPWNRFQQPSSEPRFEARMGQANVDPEQIVTLQPETFVERFRHSPLKRPKLAGLQRNALMLLNSSNNEHE